MNTLAPLLLSDLEAARLLRLDEGAPNDEATVKRLNRLVDKRLLRPCIVGGKRRYSPGEIQRFIDAETARYAEVRE